MNGTYLNSTFFINSDHPKVLAYAHSKIEPHASDTEKSIALFEAVRDGYFYDPYHLDLRPQALVASNILQRRAAYCIEKAVLLCALLRAVGIPSRLNFGNVKNHIAVERIVNILKTDVLVFHGCTEVRLADHWIKLTPAFNKSLCEKLGVPVLEFDGKKDAVFQQYSDDGTVFMEYVHDYGSFDDLPYAKMLNSFSEHYPHLEIPEDLILNLD
ncbi:transglutaminase domain-containing protein [Flavobacteriaceae bacterium TP-CH-4]|uniref:Transglutaminase domain-containing protein n=1 Tax=Pelagihabitans pacificus TaxID=2696054 RepID=A0A967AS22_9FLAO|nr:transglutaminase-like domain-containing protein [Pelagihabitans pacificus]NHF59243.1 transglutaminase domain-containing protein [Pelagihabitans pacificus]